VTGLLALRGWRLALLAAAVSLLVPARPAGAAPARPESVLVSYSFDDEVATGPDTFAVWQGARHTKGGRGRVSLTTAFHVSGHRSVELRDVAGDGDFPELQGYFPVRASGRLFFHFAFLVTDPKEELNVALAGPRFFQLEKDGLAFWLGTREGRLVHYSDSIPKTLFAPEAFAWYAVDVVYDIPSGTYDLVIRREGREEPLVSLRRQPNTIRQPGSAIDKFSFVGAPFTDRSRVVYYVDDVVIGTDEGVARSPFVAPGRRKLFIDSFAEYQRLLRERPRCLPPLDPEDLGFTPDDLAEVQAAGLSDAVAQLLTGEKTARPASLERGGEAWRRVLDAAWEWGEGCTALEAGDATKALAHFGRAAHDAPGGRLFQLSAALALAALKRIDEADERLALLSEWRHDPRYAVASAYVGLARGDLERAREWLQDPARDAVDRDPGGKEAASVEALVTEQYYYVLLWKGDYDDARDYALRMAERAGRLGLAVGAWRVRGADASFYRRDVAEARELYSSALASEKDHGALREIYLRLADLAFLDGDLGEERRLREHYYGALGE
jgi:tetratricopeptide (TPR) repeat protein